MNLFSSLYCREAVSLCILVIVGLVVAQSIYVHPQGQFNSTNYEIDAKSNHIKELIPIFLLAVSISGLTFKSLIHFGMYFVYVVR